MQFTVFYERNKKTFEASSSLEAKAKAIAHWKVPHHKERFVLVMDNQSMKVVA